MKYENLEIIINTRKPNTATHNNQQNTRAITTILQTHYKKQKLNDAQNEFKDQFYINESNNDEINI